jgi:hypothetical protein
MAEPEPIPSGTYTIRATDTDGEWVVVGGERDGQIMRMTPPYIKPHTVRYGWRVDYQR